MKSVKNMSKEVLHVTDGETIKKKKKKTRGPHVKRIVIVEKELKKLPGIQKTPEGHPCKMDNKGKIICIYHVLP